MRRKKMYIPCVFILMGVIFVSCCSSVDAVDDPVELLVLDYRDFEYVMITSPVVVNLSFIGCEDFDSGALDVEKIGFYPGSNETKYKFTSNMVDVYHWFVPGVKDFVYQDEVSGQLYIVGIDYSDVVVPLSNEAVDLALLEELYSNLSDDYDSLLVLYNSLLNITRDVNGTLNGFMNMTDTNISTGVNLLYNSYESIQIDYNNLNLSYYSLLDNYTQLVDDYNSTYTDFQELTGVYGRLLLDYDELNTTYNTTYNMLLDKGGELSEYENFEAQLNGYHDGFYFQGHYYNTLYSYDQTIEKLESELGWIPIYIAIAILLTVIIMVAIYIFYFGRKPETNAELQDKTGYDPISDEINRFSLTGSLKNLGKRINRKPAGIQQNNDGGNISLIREEIDNHIDSKIQPLQEEISLIHTNIDKILAKI